MTSGQKSAFSKVCRDCQAIILFDDSVRSPSGRLIPLNPKDRSRHDCENSAYVRRRNAVERES